MFYRIIDFITEKKYILLAISIILIIVFAVGYKYTSSNKDKGETLGELSELEDDYTPPDSSLPKDLDSLFKELTTINDSNLKLEIKGDTIEVNLTEGERVFTSYIQYSTKYDCTTVMLDKEDEQPLSILYHFEYDNLEEYKEDLVKSIGRTKGDVPFKVNLTNDEGEIRLNVEEGVAN